MRVAGKMRSPYVFSSSQRGDHQWVSSNRWAIAIDIVIRCGTFVVKSPI
ncbi:MAG: hypothetical protein AAFR58_12460 [Cyanobacteria bacterium J06627_28]